MTKLHVTSDSRIDNFLEVYCIELTLMTSQGSDTVTAIFKCNSSNTITSLRVFTQFAVETKWRSV